MERRQEHFAQIPAGLDILVSHSPAFGVLDRSHYKNEHAGCPALLHEVSVKQPKHMIHGHIHEGRQDGAMSRIGQTIVHNVAMWERTWQPAVIEL